MASSGVNVLRYAALGTGIFYGFYHQSKLTTAAKVAAADREYQHKQSLIDKAKAEFSKKNSPSSSKTEGGDIIRDPNDKRFDLEAFLNVIQSENP